MGIIRRRPRGESFAYARRRFELSFTAPGMTYPETQSAAFGRCNSDERTRGHCQSRTTACADGR
jgi:hypothetical protein